VKKVTQKKNSIRSKAFNQDDKIPQVRSIH
jgi:hypothetical protein